MENPVILSVVRTAMGKFMGGLAALGATEPSAKTGKPQTRPLTRQIHGLAKAGKSIDAALLGKLQRTLPDVIY